MTEADKNKDINPLKEVKAPKRKSRGKSDKSKVDRRKVMEARKQDKSKKQKKSKDREKERQKRPKTKSTSRSRSRSRSGGKLPSKEDASRRKRFM